MIVKKVSLFSSRILVFGFLNAKEKRLLKGRTETFRPVLCYMDGEEKKEVPITKGVFKQMASELGYQEAADERD